MKKLIFLLISLIININIYSQNYKTYNNIGKDFEYSIDYPTDFKIISTKEALKLVSPLKDSIIIIVSNISPFKSFEEFEGIWLKNIDSQLEDFELLDKSNIIIDSKKGFSYVYRGKDSGLLLKYKRYSIDSSPNIYEIIYEAKEDIFDLNIDKVDAIVNTIKIKK